MPVTTSVTCPDCQALLKIPAAIPAGKKIRCPKCQATFVVTPEVEDVVPKVTELVIAPPKMPARQSIPVEEIDEDLDDQPSGRTRRRPEMDEDEDEEEPRSRRPAARGSPVLLWTLIVGGAVVLIGGGAAVYFFVLQGKDAAPGPKDRIIPNGISKPQTNWPPRPELLDKLGPEIAVLGIRIRPPKGYFFEQKLAWPETKYVWKGPQRPGGTKPTLALSVFNLGPNNASLDQVFTFKLAELKKSWAWYLPKVSTSPVEHGQINGMNFARARVKLANADGTMKMEGFVYLTLQGQNGYLFTATEKEQNSQDLKLHEAAVCTFRKQ